MQDHTPRKRFGQNFLHDPNIILRIIRSPRFTGEDHVVEIGPGLGALTDPLAALDLHRLDLVELDRDLAQRLSQRFGQRKEIHLHPTDALSFDFGTLVADRPLRIIGNLPYNISTPLIFHLLEYAPHIRDMHFMLQKEVVDRLAAPPGGKTRGRLSVMAQWHCDIKALFRVPPGAFHPPPKVESAIVRMVPRQKRPACLLDFQTFDMTVRKAFEQRRKTLRNALNTVASPSCFERAGVQPEARAATLEVRDFVHLANAIHDSTWQQPVESSE